MRALILQRGEGLDPIAAKVIAILRKRLEVPHQAQATECNRRDHMGHSDAG